MVADKDSKSEKVITRVLRSKSFLIISILVLIVLTYFLGKVIQRKYEVSQEIKKMEEKRDTLVQENGRLQDLLEYLKTDTYKDRVAREDLGLQKEGETVVVVDEGEDAVRLEKELLTTTVAQEDEEIAYIPTYKEWWNYFFASK